MTTGSSEGDHDGEIPFSVTTEIEDERTVVTVTGDRDVAVVVNSVSGERVYLPPENSERDDDSSYRPTGSADSPYEGIQDDSPYEGIQDDSPYEGIQDDSPYEGIQGDSPYEGIQDDSPYGSRPEPDGNLGVTPIANGFQVVHPEAADDVRFLR